MTKLIIITEDIIGRIDDLKQYAEDHVFKLDDLKKIIAGKKDAVGDDEKFVMWIGDYRIAYSIEENLNGFYKHISVSNNFEVPSPDIFGFILNIFGMRQLNKEMLQAGKQHLYFEHDNKVPNVLERIEIEHGMGKWKLLPCSPDVCQECAVDHKPEEPHNKDSLYYKMTFKAKHGRYPTWNDAIAHCSDSLKYAIREFLEEKGIDLCAGKN